MVASVSFLNRRAGGGRLSQPQDLVAGVPHHLRVRLTYCSDQSGCSTRQTAVPFTTWLVRQTPCRVRFWTVSNLQQNVLNTRRWRTEHFIFFFSYSWHLLQHLVLFCSQPCPLRQQEMVFRCRLRTISSWIFQV